MSAIHTFKFMVLLDFPSETILHLGTRASRPTEPKAEMACYILEVGALPSERIISKLAPHLCIKRPSHYSAKLAACVMGPMNP